MKTERQTSVDRQLFRVVRKEASSDGFAVKWCLEASDGAQIECVELLTRTRGTLCVSTQVGCSLACTFCATGKLGFRRDLTAEEIIAQLETVRANRGETIVRTGARGRSLSHLGAPAITNIVLMGMGEPLLNLENVLRAIEVFQDQKRWANDNLPIRTVGLSTVGIPDKIIALAEKNPAVRLAISLHAPDDDLRSELMPANRRWKLSEVLQAAITHQKITKKPTMFEYVCLSGVNDSLEQARTLAELLHNQKAFVNLIPYNEIAGGFFKRSSNEACLAFLHELKTRGLEGRIRTERGASVRGACGQLAGS